MEAQKSQTPEMGHAPKKRSGIKRGIYVLPSLLTTGSLFSGFFSIQLSIQQHFFWASCLLLISAFLDLLDGRMARLTKTQTKFGLEYDSLVDFMSFGIAPAILVFLWNLNALPRLGFAAAFLFATCGALRLARFNVTTSTEKRFFQGLPIPMAAGGLVSLVIFQTHVLGDIKISPYLVTAWTLLLAFLMVSNVRYRNFKQIDFSKPTSFLFLVAILAVVFVLVSAFHESLFFLSLGYISSGIIETLIRRSRDQNEATLQASAKKAEESPENVIPLSVQNKKEDGPLLR